MLPQIQGISSHKAIELAHKLKTNLRYFLNNWVLALWKRYIYYINNPKTCKDRKDKLLKIYANNTLQNTVFIWTT